MAAAHHTHHAHHGNHDDHGKTLAQRNAEFWSSAADTIFEPQWTKDLHAQLRNHLLSNLEWAGIDPDAKSNEGLKKEKSLDYACGEGFLARTLAPYVSKSIGMDIAEGMQARFNKTAREQGFAEDHVFGVVGDITSADHPASLDGPEYFNFDLIIVSMALHHMENPQEAINRFVQRLRPGSGTLVVIDWEARESDPVPSVDDGKDKGGKKIEELFKEYHPAMGTVAHAGFAKEQFEEMVTRAGCDVADFVLLPEKSVIPMAKDGEMQIFFGKGKRRA